MRTIIPILLLIAVSSQVLPQDKYAAELEQELIQRYKSMMDAYPDKAHYTLAESFKDSFVSHLKRKETFSFPFASLGKYLKIVQSEDHKLRIFSWDELSGGTCHDMAAIAQFVHSDGTVGVQELDSAFYGDPQPQDNVLFEKIHHLKIGKVTHYLTIGWGTCGGGHHFRVVQACRLGNGALVRPSIFELDGERSNAVVVDAARTHKIKIELDADKRIITYDDFQPDQDTGFMLPTGKKVKLALENDVFRKQE